MLGVDWVLTERTCFVLLKPRIDTLFVEVVLARELVDFLATRVLIETDSTLLVIFRDAHTARMSKN